MYTYETQFLSFVKDTTLGKNTFERFCEIGTLAKKI